MGLVLIPGNYMIKEAFSFVSILDQKPLAHLLVCAFLIKKTKRSPAEVFETTENGVCSPVADDPLKKQFSERQDLNLPPKAAFLRGISCYSKFHSQKTHTTLIFCLHIALV